MLYIYIIIFITIPIFWDHLKYYYSKNQFIIANYIYKNIRASLVAQWLRTCLLMQGTRVRALVWEDPACRGATRPVSHNC